MDKIEEVLTRGVVEVIDRQHLEKKLRSGQKLRIKHGIDPTGPQIHIGRASQLLKLRAFQKMGHQVILILGTFTGRIGDASDKDSMRPMLSEKQIRKNVKTYRQQIGKILDLKKTEIRENSEWFDKLEGYDLFRLTSKFTYAQIIERDLFQKRLTEGKDLGLHELFYPLLQGYDSVEVKADLEIGGTDQKFNLLTGRDVQRGYGQEPQDIMTLEMVPGTDGRKMSTSWGNIISITDPPNEMFGKIMSMKDELIIKYFELCTEVPLQLIKAHKKALQSNKVNPMDLKKKLAFEIVKMYYGELSAKNAEKEFKLVFQKRKMPEENIPYLEIKVTENIGVGDIVNILAKGGLVSSKSEAKRLIDQGGVDIDGSTINHQSATISLKDGSIIRAGKRKFLKIHLV